MTRVAAPSGPTAEMWGEVLRASSSSVYDARGNGDGEITPTMTGDHESRVTDYTAVLVEKHE